MKLPVIASAPLECRPGEPSAALRRAAEVWPAPNCGSQLASILQTANLVPPRFVVVATAHDSQGAELPLGAVLAECLPGRSAIVMSPQVEPATAEPTRSAIATNLLLSLEQVLGERDVLLAQGLTLNRLDAGRRISSCR